MIDIQPGIDRFHATLYLRGPTLSDFAQSSTSAELTQSSRRKVLGIRLQQAVNLQIVHQGVRDVGNAPFDAWLSTLIIFEDAWSHGLRSRDFTPLAGRLSRLSADAKPNLRTANSTR